MSNLEPPFDFDLNSVPAKIDLRLAEEADYWLRAVGVAPSGGSQGSPRKTALTALSAARAVIAQFARQGISVTDKTAFPTAQHGEKANEEKWPFVTDWRGDFPDAAAAGSAYALLDGALGALQVELCDLEGGAGAGLITRPVMARGNRPAVLSEVKRAARAVVAVQWFRRLGLSQSGAIDLVVKSGYDGAPFDRIAVWVDTFSRPRFARRRSMLSELWQGVEISQGVDIDTATPDDVTAWLINTPTMKLPPDSNKLVVMKSSSCCVANQRNKLKKS